MKSKKRKKNSRREDNLCTWKIYEEPNISYGKIINVKFILNNLENLHARIFILIYTAMSVQQAHVCLVCTSNIS